MRIVVVAVAEAGGKVIRYFKHGGQHIEVVK